MPPLNYGGTERVIFDLAMAQKEAGHDVTVFACDTSTIDVPVIGQFVSLAGQETLRDHKFIDLPPGLAGALEAKQLSMLSRFHDEFDVIHLHGGMAATALLDNCEIPAVRTIHWRADELDHQQFFNDFPNQQVVAISAAQAISIPESNLAGIVHHGIDIERYQLSSKTPEHLLFLGRMSDQKRPDRAIEIAKKAGRKLILAGDIDPGNRNYFSKFVEPHLNDQVQYVGPVDDEQKQQLLETALALLFPIDWPEPFGLVMIEAMACGTPIVAWDNGSVPEIIDSGLTGYVTGSISEATSAVVACEKMVRNQIRETFELRFCRKLMAAKYDLIYNDIIDIERSPAKTRYRRFFDNSSVGS